jgi:dTDP-4-amino-4,6-dideoxygalactose transaminase
MPDPIPEAAHADVMALLQSGRLYRYHNGGGDAAAADDGDINDSSGSSTSIVSHCEQDIAAYTGHRYCVAVNSCGSALFLLLKTTGLPLHGPVLTNAFTFGAVPSAIVHAGGTPVYVESTWDMVVDVPDLARKLRDHPECRHVLISHMRGKVGDMAAVRELCRQHQAVLLEDCAHSLGVHYENEHSGHVGVACAISSQSYKMLNSGEGGFVLTNDADICARAAVYAGAYESLSSQHLTVPPPAAFGDYAQTLPNYSLRMSNLAAVVIRPQIATLDERIAQYQDRYDRLVATVTYRVGRYLTIPRLDPAVTRMVHDSFQFTLNEEWFHDDVIVQSFLDECASHGLPVERFGHHTNCRNFVNWKFAPTTDPLPQTAAMLRRSCDVRLPLQWDETDLVDLANVIMESIEHVLLLGQQQKDHHHPSPP